MLLSGQEGSLCEPGPARGSFLLTLRGSGSGVLIPMSDQLTIRLVILTFQLRWTYSQL